MYRTTILMLTLLVSGPVWAQDDPAALLRGFLNSTQTLAGRFEQQQLDEAGNVYEASEGQFYLQRPGRFRWDYHTPYVQTVVSDGVTLWHYDPDLAQVLVRRLGDALSATPAVLLAGGSDLESSFVLEEQEPQGELRIVQLTPRAEEAEFQRATLAMLGDTPAWLEIEDPLGGLTRMTFVEVLSNVQLKPSLFSFEPPAGVEVVGEAAPANP